MNPRISIVVPIFNMERYLHRCLDSLLNQTFRHVEIIAVNDGSEDGSLAVLERYAAADSRVVVVNSSNQGVSAARNLGLSLCRGEYIGFVDPDDWIECGMYEELLAAALKEDVDIVMCSYNREFGTHSKPKPFPLEDETIFRGRDVQVQMTRRLLGPIGAEVASPEHLDAWGTVWCKLYRAKLLREAGCSFTDLKLIGSNEDTLFNLAACGAARSFMFLNRPYYHYWRANEGSITSRHKPNLAQQFFRLYELMAQQMQRLNPPFDYREALDNRIAMNVLGLGLNLISPTNPASVKEKAAQIKRLLTESAVRAALKSFQTSHCSIVWKLFFAAAKRRMAWALYMMLAGIEIIRTKKIRGSGSGAHSYSPSSNNHESRRTRNDANELLQAAEPERHSI